MNVLVLCTGNRWRSPLYAELLRRARPDWEVRSAGTHCSRPGADLPRAWRACLPGWVDDHRAVKALDSDISWADVVLGV